MPLTTAVLAGIILLLLIRVYLDRRDIRMLTNRLYKIDPEMRRRIDKHG